MTAPFPGTVQRNTIRLHFELLTNASTASFGVNYSGPSFNTSQAQLQAWADAAAAAVGGAVGTVLKGFTTVNCALVGVTTSYSIGQVQQSVAAAETTAIGGTGTNLNPPQDAICFSLKTTRTGKSYRGRAYWPYTGGAMSNGGQAVFVGPTALAEFDALLRGISTASPTTGLVPVVWSRKLDVTTPVAALAVDFSVDTQRRRKTKPAQPVSSPY